LALTDKYKSLAVFFTVSDFKAITYSFKEYSTWC